MKLKIVEIETHSEPILGSMLSGVPCIFKPRERKKLEAGTFVDACISRVHYVRNNDGSVKISSYFMELIKPSDFKTNIQVFSTRNNANTVYTFAEYENKRVFVYPPTDTAIPIADNRVCDILNISHFPKTRVDVWIRPVAHKFQALGLEHAQDSIAHYRANEDVASKFEQILKLKPDYKGLQR